MPTVDPVILKLQAEWRDYRNAMNSSTMLVERSLRQQERAVQRLEFQMQYSSDRMAATVSRLGAALGAVSVGALARQLLEYADAAKQIDAQLALATRTFGNFAVAQADVQRLASETRAGLQETATLYGNFARAAASMGGTQEQAARATETFSKAIAIGGASAAEAASATLQFGQALASGALRGDEFNSVAEASPRLLQLIADALGKPRSELRKMAEEGRLTTDVLWKALTERRFTTGIDEEFKTLPITFNKAMQQVNNAAIITFGAFDQGGEFSTALADFITGGADGFKDLADRAEEFGADTRAVFEGLGNVFDPIGANGNAVFDALGIKIYSVRDQIRSLLGSIDAVRNALPDLERRAQEFDKRTFGTTFGRPAPAPASDLLGAFDRGDRQAQSRLRVQRIARDLERKGFTFERDANGLPIQSTLKPPKPKKPVVVDPPGGGDDDKKKKKGPSAETLARRAEAARLRAERDDERFAAEKAALNQDLLRARQAVATAAETVAQYELQAIEDARARQNASYQRDVSEKALTQARADELIALNDAVAAERARAVIAERDERLAQERVDLAAGDLTNQRDLLSAEEALADTTDERRKIALRLLDLQYEEERLRLQAIEDSKKANDVDKAIARRRLAMLPTLREAEEKRIRQDTRNDYQRYRDELPDTIAEVNDELARFKVGTLRTLEDELVNSAKAALGLKGALGDVVGELLRIGIQRRLMGPIADALFGKADGSTAGVVGGFISKIFGRASGGYVAPGQTVRVNENRGGVELLRMGSQGGTVIPLGQASARATKGGDRHFHISVDQRGSITPERYTAQLSAELLARADALDRQRQGETLRAAPAAVQRAQRYGM